LSPAQKDTAREAGVKLASLRGIVWVGRDYSCSVWRRCFIRRQSWSSEAWRPAPPWCWVALPWCAAILDCGERVNYLGVCRCDCRGMVLCAPPWTAAAARGCESERGYRWAGKS